MDRLEQKAREVSTLVIPAARTVQVVQERNWLRMLAAGTMLAIGLGILAWAMSGSDAAKRDYICYWAAAQQIIHNGDPYDRVAVLRIERAYGYSNPHAAIMRNPPYAFPLLLPLFFASERVGAILWSLAIIGALTASIRMLWWLNGRQPDRLHSLGYFFPPALACLLTGQVGAFLLLGLTLFLYLHDSRPVLAGAALTLCATKPHLFIVFGAVILIWIVRRRAYEIIAGLIIALTACVAFGLLLDPFAWSQYAAGIRAENILGEFIPTTSLLFRLAIDRQAAWLQFVPVCAAVIWASWYFWNRRDRWDWRKHGNLLILVSVLVAPYAWFTDEAVVLPAIFAGLYRTSNSGRSLLPFACILCIGMIEVLCGVPPNSGAYLWTAPIWLLWYLWSTR